MKYDKDVTVAVLVSSWNLILKHGPASYEKKYHQDYYKAIENLEKETHKVIEQKRKEINTLFIKMEQWEERLF